MSGTQLELGDSEHSVALKKAWERAVIMLATRVSKVTYESYIRQIKPLGMEGRLAALGVPSPFAREWLEKRHSLLIRSTLESLLGFAVDVEFRVLPASSGLSIRYVRQPDGSPVEPASITLVAPEAEPSRPAPQPPVAKVVSYPDLSLPLNERFTFEAFIVGKSNRLASAAAQAVAQHPANSYNPLFIYGNCGLGKTHLLHAIGIELRNTRPELRVALVDGENFTYQYVKSLRERKTEDFRGFYRTTDVWLVDDIQFVAGKEQTKEEFFHTFNALYQTGRQIVICSDRSPRELRTMDERITTRFESGLIADINPPALETRVAILEQRCECEGWDVPSPVLYFMAEAIQSNIRALEGAITKLIAYSSVMGAEIDTELAQDVLGEFFIDKRVPVHPRKSVKVDVVLEAVAGKFGLNADVIRGERREAKTALARAVAMFICRDLGDMPLAQIGMEIGGRDHTTVQRAVKKIEGLLQMDPKVQSLVLELRSLLDR